MKAMVLEEIMPVDKNPLKMLDVPTPEPESNPSSKTSCNSWARNCGKGRKAWSGGYKI